MQSNTSAGRVLVNRCNDLGPREWKSRAICRTCLNSVSARRDKAKKPQSVHLVPAFYQFHEFVTIPHLIGYFRSRQPPVPPRSVISEVSYDGQRPVYVRGPAEWQRTRDIQLNEYRSPFECVFAWIGHGREKKKPQQSSVLRPSLLYQFVTMPCSTGHLIRRTEKWLGQPIYARGRKQL